MKDGGRDRSGGERERAGERAKAAGEPGGDGNGRPAGGGERDAPDRRVRRALRVSRSSPDLDGDIRDELDFYVEMRARELVEHGVDPVEARRRAEASFGDRHRMEEELKRFSAPAVRRRVWARALGELGLDLRHALRRLRRGPGFAAAAVLILGLGIGANTAVFSVVNAILLEPLDYPEPDRLLQVWEADRRAGSLEGPVSPVDLADWQARSTRLEALAGYAYEAMALTGEGFPERIVGIAVSSSFFRVMGVSPVLGRAFQPGEEGPGNRVVILSDGLWKNRFGSDPEIIGRALALDGVPHEIVGVMPEGFSFPQGGRLWVPFSFDVGRLDRGAHFVFAVGRMAPDVTLEEARQEMTAVAAQLAEEYADTNRDHGVRLVPLDEQLVAGVEARLWLVLGAVGLVLLIACANVGNLLLARTASRHQEIAIRAALGAGRWRLVRQLLTESVVLALLAGTVGVSISIWGVDALLAASPLRLPRVDEIGVDGVMLAFALGASLLSGVLFGVIPSVQLLRVDPRPGLTEAGSRATAGRGTRRLRTALVVAEVALTLLLLVGAGLLVGNVAQLEQVDPGFDAEGVLTARIALPDERYDSPQRRAAFLDALLQRLGTLSRVQAFGAVDSLPFSGSRSSSSFHVDGEVVSPATSRSADLRMVSPGYLRTMGIPLLRGRGLAAEDDADSRPVILVNRAFARRFLGGEDVIGRRIRIGSPAEIALYGEPVWREVVGVVGDLIHDDLTAPPAPEMYVPYRQYPLLRIALALRTAADPADLAAAVRETVLEVDPDQPVHDMATMAERLDAFLAAPRVNAGLLVAFSAAALLLAVLGIYSVVSYTVTLRTHELGVRVALGAGRSDVMWLVLARGMAQVGVGLALGLGGSLLATRVVRSLLFNLSPADPRILAGSTGLLAVVGLLACWLPARRALRVDPVEALRADAG